MISKEGRNINRNQAYDYVAGYFLSVDITDRKLQQTFKIEQQPWTLSKGQDGFLPVSNFIEKEKVKNPHNLTISLYVNHNLRQMDNTGNMHFKIPDMLEYISQFITFYPGDLILTGTPHGIGPLEIGDTLKGEIKQDNDVLVEMNFNIEKF